MLGEAFCLEVTRQDLCCFGLPGLFRPGSMWLFLLKAQLVSYILGVDHHPAPREQAHDTFDEGLSQGIVNCQQRVAH